MGGREREERKRPQDAGSYTIDELCRTYYIQARTKGNKKGKKEFGLWTLNCCLTSMVPEFGS